MALSTANGPDGEFCPQETLRAHRTIQARHSSFPRLAHHTLADGSCRLQGERPLSSLCHAWLPLGAFAP